MNWWLILLHLVETSIWGLFYLWRGWCLLNAEALTDHSEVEAQLTKAGSFIELSGSMDESAILRLLTDCSSTLLPAADH